MKKLVLSRKKAIRLFKQFGFKEAKNWDNATFERKLKNVSELMQYIRRDSFTMKKTFNKITRSDLVVVKSEKPILNNKKEVSKMATLTIKRKTAVKIFEALGFKTATKWNAKRMAAKLGNLEDLTDGVDIEDPKMASMIKKIVKADKVIIGESTKTEEAPVEEKKTSKKKSAKKSKKKAKKADKEVETPKKKKKEKKSAKKSDKKKSAKKTDKKTSAKDKKGMDSFGSRIGTNNAVINKCISKKPKNMKEIVEQAGLSGSFYNHLNKLAEKGLIKKNDDKKYSLNSK